MLHDRAAAGGRIVFSGHFQLISIHIINIRVSFPCVVDFGYGNELDCLPLEEEISIGRFINTLNMSKYIYHVIV